MNASGLSLGPFRIIWKGFQGISAITGLQAAKATTFWQGGLFALLLSMGVLLAAVIFFFPYYEENAFLLRVPLLPIMFLGATMALSTLFQLIGGRPPLDFANLFYVGGMMALVMALTLGGTLAVLYFALGSVSSLWLLAAVLLTGTAWSAVQLHHFWTQLLGIKSGLTTAVAGVLVGGVQMACLQFWYANLAADFLYWNEMLFLD